MEQLHKLHKYSKKYNMLIDQIGGSLADPENVLLLHGHGCSIIDEILDVPPNCVYVTYTLCGNGISIDSDGVMNFMRDFSDKLAELRDPITNLMFLKEKYYENIHVHYPWAQSEHSRRYMNCMYTFPIDWVINDRVKLYAFQKSGILPMSKYSIIAHEIIRNKLFDNDNILTPTDIHYMFDESIHPTTESIMHYMTLYNNKGNVSLFKEHMKTYNITQKEIFEKFRDKTGTKICVFYNIVCRPNCNETEITGIYHPKILLRRAHSFDGDDAEIKKHEMEQYAKLYHLHYRVTTMDSSFLKFYIHAPREYILKLYDLDDNNNSLMHIALLVGNVDVAEILLGPLSSPRILCDINVTNNNNETIFHIAAKKNHIVFLHMLLYKIANNPSFLKNENLITTQENITLNTMMHYLCSNDANYELLHYFFSVVANFGDVILILTIFNAKGNTPIHIACINKCDRIIHMLRSVMNRHEPFELITNSNADNCETLYMRPRDTDGL
jgi:ankyrin repeat protein